MQKDTEDHKHIHIRTRTHTHALLAIHMFSPWLQTVNCCRFPHVAFTVMCCDIILNVGCYRRWPLQIIPPLHIEFKLWTWHMQLFWRVVSILWDSCSPKPLSEYLAVRKNSLCKDKNPTPAPWTLFNDSNNVQSILCVAELRTKINRSFWVVFGLCPLLSPQPCKDAGCGLALFKLSHMYSLRVADKQTMPGVSMLTVEPLLLLIPEYLPRADVRRGVKRMLAISSTSSQ